MIPGYGSDGSHRADSATVAVKPIELTVKLPCQPLCLGLYYDNEQATDSFDTTVTTPCKRGGLTRGFCTRRNKQCAPHPNF